MERRSFDVSAVRVPDLKPGDPEWAKRMSASKVAAVLGLSPFESPFSLWHRMAGNLPWDDGQNLDEKNRGHYLEPGIRQWFRDRHPTLQVDRTGTWAHPDRDWQIASPDGIAIRRSFTPKPVAVVECKTANNDWEWGEPLTDQVPPYYRAQAIWQMDTLGLPVCHMAVLTSFLDFREYVVEYDKDEADFIRGACRDFLDSLAAGNAPDIDEHDATYQAVRQLHPDIDDTTVELPADIVLPYVDACRAEKTAKAAKASLVTRIADAMGTARRATYMTTTVATRAAKQGGTPYVTTARGLVDRFDATPGTTREKASA